MLARQCFGPRALAVLHCFQDGVVLLGHDDGCKVWLNEQMVHENRAHVAAAPETHQVKVKLKKGVNKVLLKINNGDGPHGFYFAVVAEQELKVASVK